MTIISPIFKQKSLTADTPDQKSTKNILLSCMIGNALEWYDFVIYGYFAVILGAVFFPNADQTTQFLASWGIFWSGFLARPLGSIVFGHIGDKISRKFALTLSIYIMAIPTTLMGCLPTYAQIGIFAPLLLIVLRAFQGFAIGGEFTGTMVFLVEHAPQNKRGIWGSWASCSAVIGVIVGSAVVAVLNYCLDSTEVKQWGWRVPFIVSILGSFVGGYIRSNLSDTTVYKQAKEERKKEMVPLKDLFMNHKSKMSTIVFLDILTAVGFFMVVVFFATYFRTYLNFDDRQSLIINTINMCVFALAIIVGGWLSDRYGRKPVLKYPCIGFIILSYPLFQMLQIGDYQTLLIVQGIFAVMMGIFFGAIPTALVEIMPTSVRFSGLSISHNVSMAIFGGGTPFLATQLIKYTNNLASPAFLLIAAGVMSLVSLRYVKEKFQSDLD